MNSKYKKVPIFQKGFTLIELLIVIAIIGILSSIVIVSLYQARTKSKVAVSETEARQLALLLQQQFADTGSYNGLLPNTWMPSGYTCDSAPLSGPYVTDYRRVCNSVMNRLGTEVSLNNMLVGDYENTGANFSVMIKTVPGYSITGEWFCLGSSGRTYRGSWNPTAPGCYSNP